MFWKLVLEQAAAVAAVEDPPARTASELSLSAEHAVWHCWGIPDAVAGAGARGTTEAVAVAVFHADGVNIGEAVLGGVEAYSSQVSRPKQEGTKGAW